MRGFFVLAVVTPMLIGVIFLVSFGIVSLGTLAYFRYRPKRNGVAADR